ncbi:hypothetical protein JTB14_009483 [Gonioctena quinquepunctata]|nr:hypothetical protein JTB14_009483 [Gonioctena quinquepunctata]
MFKIHESSCEDDWPSCDGTKNIVCEREGQCGDSSDCTLFKPDEKFRRLVLDEHNNYRNFIAVGNNTSYGGPAANMMALSYDLELEYAAICTATKCKYEYDKCRRTKKYTAGQSMQVSSSDRIQSAFNYWFQSDMSTLNRSIIKAYSGSVDNIFTQIMWAETTRIGCARSRREHKLYYLVCNYGNAGNIVGSPIFIGGTQCSKCPTGVSCNAKYAGLCGEIDESDLTKAPLDFSYYDTNTQASSHRVCFHQILLMVPHIIIILI